MGKTAIVLMVFLLFASVCFAAFTPSENQTKDKVNDAKDAKEEAGEAVYNGQTDFGMDFLRCPEVHDDWQEAENKLNIAEDLYDSAFEDFILGNYNDSYYTAQNSIEASNDAISLVEGLSGKLFLCDAKERRENASAALTAMTAKKNEVEDAVMAKLVCPDVQANWTKGNEQMTLANTQFTGSNYVDAKEAAERAIEYYEAAAAAAETCVPPEIPEEPEIECEVDIHCEDDEVCVEGQCIPVECECGYVSNHICHEYECCEDTDCPSGQICVGHVCAVEQEPPFVSVPEETPPKEESPEYTCNLAMLLLLGLLGAVISREN